MEGSLAESLTTSSVGRWMNIYIYIATSGPLWPRFLVDYNHHHHYQHHHHNSPNIVQVRCDRGFQLIGNSRLKCRNGVWSGPTPVCTVLGDFLWYNIKSTVIGDFHFIIKSNCEHHQRSPSKGACPAMNHEPWTIIKSQPWTMNHAPSTISIKRRLPGHWDPDQRTRDSRPRIKDVRVQVFCNLQ